VYHPLSSLEEFLVIAFEPLRELVLVLDLNQVHGVLPVDLYQR
jgi:hypothetical protein